MILVMKKNSIKQKYILECSPHQYWSAWKKQILAKTFHLLASIWALFFKLLQMLGPNVLASSVKQHDYNNLTFEVHANKGFFKCTQNNIIIVIISSTC
jgi:hypothetical protein